jgi:hypothetical protein
MFAAPDPSILDLRFGHLGRLIKQTSYAILFANKDVATPLSMIAIVGSLFAFAGDISPVIKTRTSISIFFML